MGLLLLVRHGQASFLADDYDRLSPVGEEQARGLGRHWAELEIVPDRVYVGPLRRHVQTYRAFAEGYGTRCPDALPLPELDEHLGQKVVERMLPRLAEEDASVGELARRHHTGDEQAAREYLRLFQRVTRRWARGELEVPELEERWTDFRARVERGLARIANENPDGKTVAAFTSGGVIAAAAGAALDVADEKIMELSWTIRNASYSELLFSGRRLSLRSFNAVAPAAVTQHTYV